jgi:hypothetical protein
MASRRSSAKGSKSQSSSSNNVTSSRRKSSVFGGEEQNNTDLSQDVNDSSEQDEDEDNPEKNLNKSQIESLKTSRRIWEEKNAGGIYDRGPNSGGLVLVKYGLNADGTGGFQAKRHWAEEEDMAYTEKMRMRSLPSTYTKDSVMSLLPPKRADVTDTTLRDRSAIGRMEGVSLHDTTTSTTSDAINRELFNATNRFNPNASGPLLNFDGLTQTFDSSAMKTDVLRKELFYVSPYLTCEECNGIVYIDAAILRSRLGGIDKLDVYSCDEKEDEDDNIPPPPTSTYSVNAPTQAAVKTSKKKKKKKRNLTIEPEPLPPCPGCLKTNTFRIGAEDLTTLLASNKEELARRKRVKKRMIVKIQKFYRAYLARCYGRAARHAILIARMLKARSCAAIQAMARARAGRKRRIVEEALLVIKNAHVILLNRAKNIVPPGSRMKIFWYKTKNETDVLFKDYYTLVDRTGYNPPLFIVEANILEIAKRILIREAELCTNVQKRWRGIVVRRYLNVYRKECTRVREICAACVFRVQRVFRGWWGRKVAMVLKAKRKDASLIDSYQRERFKAQAAEASSKEANLLKIHYIKERQEEKTARYTGLVNPKNDIKGRKMKAFEDSSYGTSHVTTMLTNYMENVTESIDRDKEERDIATKRAQWVRAEQRKHPGAKLYFEDEMVARREGIIERLRKERPLRNVALLLLDHNTRKDKDQFKYPKGLDKDPQAILKEDIIPGKMVRRDKNGRKIRSQEEIESLLIEAENRKFIAGDHRNKKK